MAQQRYWNYKEDDLTRLLIRWMTGLHPEGRYFGYDLAPSADLNLGLAHSTTGFKYVEVSPLQESAFLSMIVTRQGTIITEDTALAIGTVTTGHASFDRIDTVILTHERQELAGGTQALYSIITGTPSGSPVAPPVTDPLRQTIVGTLLIPANVTQLDDGGVVWTPSKKPTFANGSPLDDIGVPPNLALVSNSAGEIVASITSATEIARVNGVTSGIQTQLNAKQATITGGATTITSSNLTASRALVSDGSGKVAVSSTTAAELAFINTVASNVQTQINSKQATITGAATTITSSNLTINRALISNASGKVAVANVTNVELSYLDNVTSAIQTQLNSKQATITGAATTITSSNLTVSRALASDGSGKVSISVTTAQELQYLNLVTSNIQTQLNSKEPTITMNASRVMVSDGSSNPASSVITTTELGWLDGVTNNIQTQLNARQLVIAGAATTITTANLTVNRALISNASGKVAVSGVTTTELNKIDGLTATTTELNYIDGVTSDIQTQLDSMLEIDSAGDVTVAKIKIIEINDWNMDSTSSINVSHGLTVGNIIGCEVMIRHDNNASRRTLNGPDIGGFDGYFTVDTSNVFCARVTGGTFDSTNYDSTGYNRGWILITHVQ